MNVQESAQPPLHRADSAGSVAKSGSFDDRDNKATPADDVRAYEEREVRPPLDYSSFGAFWASLVVHLDEEVHPVAAVYTPYTIYQYGFKGWGNVILRDGWKYFILAACDVEGNFLVVKAYEYTNLLSCMLLDAWAIPACAFFAWLYMRPKYHWTQLIGILICVGGMGMLVASDHLTGTGQYPAASMVKGDMFMLAGATLYGFTNATEEFLVRKRPLYEVVGQLGMYGMIINAIQASGLEHDGMRTANWNGTVIGLLVAYTAAMFILYTTAPLIYRAASSVYYNLSLLSSDFYGLLFGLGLYHYRPYWLYFVAFVVIICGLIAYFWHSTPEEQGKLDPRAPKYVTARADRQAGDSSAPV
ncbi:hypothetical protein FRC10_010968 [Ceratobasidium sp. 414]|nr:hypothetical protein FRC10_010968 [Ceratobasidium sp. 414]